MRVAPGPSLLQILSARAAGSAQRPRPARSTPATSPGSGRWAPPCGRGSACIGLSPHPRLLLLHIKPLPALQARAPRLGGSPRSQPWEALRPSPGFQSTTSWFLPPTLRALLASALSGDPCPAFPFRRLSLYHQPLPSFPYLAVPPSHLR